MSLSGKIYAAYKFDNDATDSHGANDLTASNITYATGKSNNGAVFNGTSSYVGVSALSINLFPLTLAFWFKKAAPGSGIFSNYAYFSFTGFGDGVRSQVGIGCDSDNGFADVYIVVGLMNGESARYQYYYNVTDNASNTIYDGNWHLIVAKFISANSLELRIDNTQVTLAEETVYGTIVNGELTIFEIGDSMTYFLDANVDEVCIFSDELTTVEMTELYNSGNGTFYPFSSAVVNNALMFSMDF